MSTIMFTVKLMLTIKNFCIDQNYIQYSSTENCTSQHSMRITCYVSAPLKPLNSPVRVIHFLK